MEMDSNLFRVMSDCLDAINTDHAKLLNIAHLAKAFLNAQPGTTKEGQRLGGLLAEQLRAYNGAPLAYRGALNPNAPVYPVEVLPVALTHEVDGAVTVIERFVSVADAEEFLSTSATIDPDDLQAGRYGIDAPEGTP